MPQPIPAARPGGARRAGARAASALLALVVATPLSATVWTRSNLSVKIPRGGQVELENASYASREWSVALKALELKSVSRPVNGVVMAIFSFHYTNTDKEPHYVAVTVRCLDAKRQERTRFTASATLQADRADGGTFEISAKLRESDWNLSTWARIVVDFLSTPEG